MHMTLHDVDIWFIIFMITSFLLGVLVLNWCITFAILYKQNIKQISVRYPKAVILSGICLSIHLMITSPLGLLINGLLFHEDQRYHVADVLYSVLQSLGFGGIAYIFIYRTWMLYFEMKWNLALQDAEWRLHIDSHLKQNINWFLRTRKTFGNPTKCGLTLFMIWLCFLIYLSIFVSINGLQKNKNIRYLSNIPMFYIFPLTFFIVSICKLPRFNDAYFVRKEIKYLVIIWIAMILSSLVWGTILGAADHGTWNYGFAHLRSSLWIIVISYLLFPWTLKKIGLPTNVYSLYYNTENVQDLQNLDKYAISAISSPSTSAEIQVQKQSDSKVTYLDILRDDIGFRAFSNHLSKSWAIENLLFMLEMIQFRNKLNEVFDDDALNDVDSAVSDLFQVTSNAPKSTLVETIDDEKQNDHDVKEKVCVCISSLIKKYIMDEGEFCLNISSQTRDELFDNIGYKNGMEIENIIPIIHKNKTEKELYTLFDKAINEVGVLLQGLFCEFQATDECKTMHAH